MAIKLIATCPDETKGVLAQELKQLGASAIAEGFRAVSFNADEELYYRCHLQLTTASNIFRILRECAGKNPEMLRSQAKRIAWPDIFSLHKSYRVDAISGDRGEEAMSSNAISKAVREAIEDSFLHYLQAKPKVDLKEPQVTVHAFVRNGRATISVKTSGKSLHKRGYRVDGHPAPLKETMAASLLHLAGYDGSQVFFDPMCGSGTLAIEAAMLACQKACNIHRKRGQFGFEHLSDFNKELWREIQDKLRTQKLEQPPQAIFAADISQAYIDLAKANALRARVEKFITFKQASFLGSEKPSPQGLLVSNLPYGERLGGDQNLKQFYQDFGNTLKQNYPGWKACLFVNDDSPWKFIGLKPQRKFSLLNGSIKTKLLIFELYEGSRRENKP